jgi:hypothetical protein
MFKENFSLALSLVFYGVYILKQTVLLDGHAKSVMLLLTVIIFSIIFLNLNQLRTALFDFKEGCIRLFLSIAIAGVLFASLIETQITIAKVALLLLFFVLIKINKHLIIRMADVGLLLLMILSILIFFNLLESTSFTNNVWQKNNLGFINPNIGPYFAFSSLYVYFVMKEDKKFWLSILIIFTFWIILGVFSRTFIIGSVILILYKLVEKSSISLFNFTRIFYLFVVFVTIASIAVSVYLISGEGSVNVVFKNIDNFSSSRLFFMSKNPFVISSSGPIILVNAFDSIYYELFFKIGPYAFSTLIMFYANIMIIKKIANSYPLEIYAITLLLFLGLFEGLIFKFSPMIAASLIILFKIRGVPAMVKAPVIK